jgi:isopentenyl-diphosphate delta-isomerase
MKGTEQASENQGNVTAVKFSLRLILTPRIATFFTHDSTHPPPMPKKTSLRTTTSRKKEHVDIVLKRDVRFRGKTTGFERWEFEHNALPEVDLRDLDTRVTFLGKRLSIPLMISCMTGGYADALRINRSLAEVCAFQGLALGVGSQRQALEDSRYHRTFSVVREVSADIPVVGNIGAAEVAGLRDPSPVQRLAELIGANAFAVHLNPVQEFLQPEGKTGFQGVLAGIQVLVKALPVPVIVKEIGAGLSSDVVRRLLDAGVRYIDVAGSGGTSWAGVEAHRRKHKGLASTFWDWGIPTADAVAGAAAIKREGKEFVLIASGGIAGGLEIAKSIALGADLAASARPVLTALERGGIREVRTLLDSWKQELLGAMFLTGSPTVDALRHARLVERRSP